MSALEETQQPQTQQQEDEDEIEEEETVVEKQLLTVTQQEEAIEFAELMTDKAFPAIVESLEKFHQQVGEIVEEMIGMVNQVAQKQKEKQKQNGMRLAITRLRARKTPLKATQKAEKKKAPPSYQPGTRQSVTYLQ